MKKQILIEQYTVEKFKTQYPKYNKILQDNINKTDSKIELHQLLDKIINIDPTYKKKTGEVGEFQEKLLKLFSNLTPLVLVNEDYHKVIQENLNTAVEYYNYKQINLSELKFNTIEELHNIVKDNVTDELKYEMKIKKLKRHWYSISYEELIQNKHMVKGKENENWETYIPLSMEQQIVLGKNTRWCISMVDTEKNLWYNYMKNPFIIQISKKDSSTKYQFNFKGYSNRKVLKFSDMDAQYQFDSLDNPLLPELVYQKEKDITLCSVIIETSKILQNNDLILKDSEHLDIETNKDIKLSFKSKQQSLIKGYSNYIIYVYMTLLNTYEQIKNSDYFDLNVKIIDKQEKPFTAVLIENKSDDLCYYLMNNDYSELVDKYDQKLFEEYLSENWYRIYNLLRNEIWGYYRVDRNLIEKQFIKILSERIDKINLELLNDIVNQLKTVGIELPETNMFEKLKKINNLIMLYCPNIITYEELTELVAKVNDAISLMLNWNKGTEEKKRLTAMIDLELLYNWLIKKLQDISKYTFSYELSNQKKQFMEIGELIEFRYLNQNDIERNNFSKKMNSLISIMSKQQKRNQQQYSGVSNVFSKEDIFMLFTEYLGKTTFKLIFTGREFQVEMGKNNIDIFITIIKNNNIFNDKTYNTLEPEDFLEILQQNDKNLTKEILSDIFFIAYTKYYKFNENFTIEFEKVLTIEQICNTVKLFDYKIVSMIKNPTPELLVQIFKVYKTFRGLTKEYLMNKFINILDPTQIEQLKTELSKQNIINKVQESKQYFKKILDI